MKEPSIPKRDPIKAYARRERASRRLPENAHCNCGESRVDALIAGSDPILCYRCQRRNEGKSGTEKHHVAGRANRPETIEIDVNEHRAELSALQYDWLENTLRNPNGSPFLVAAACIRGVVDVILWAIKTFLLWIADMLENADAYLVQRHGADWWKNTPLAIFAARRVPNA